MDRLELASRLRDAVRSLILNQWELAALDLGERTVTSHLFRHMAVRFEDSAFDVDHEYNRRYDLTKAIAPQSSDESGERRIFPDLIVHRRGRDDSNLVVIEAKKGERTDGNDRKKVSALVLQREYQYQWGVLLALGMKHSPEDAETHVAKPYGAWAPSWEWLMADATTKTAATVAEGHVFDDTELDSLDEEGWQRFSSRLCR